MKWELEIVIDSLVLIYMSDTVIQIFKIALQFYILAKLTTDNG